MPLSRSARLRRHVRLWVLLALAGGLGGCQPAAAPGGSADSPSSDDPRSAQVAPLFREVTDEVGLDFVHQTEPPGSYFFPEVNGSGAALFDFDRDGRLDIFLVNLGTGYLQPAGPTQASDRPTSHLYRQTSTGKFEDVTVRSGLVDTGPGIGVAIGDVNNDGYPDVYLTKYGGGRLFLNCGNGTFEDVTAEAGLDNPRWGTSACFFDFDRDGWLDLYVANYVDYHPLKCTRRGGGDEDYCGPQMFPTVAHKLFRNDTGRRQTGAAEGKPPRVWFTDVSLPSQIAQSRGPGMGVIAADVDGDGWPDLFVANDQAPSFLWINQRNGTFRDDAVLFGCAYDAQGKTRANMGIALGDVAGRGQLDLFVTNLDGEGTLLYRAEGANGFRDASSEAGMRDASLPYTGFGTALADLDHDGDLDILVVNGAVRRPTRPRPALKPHASVPDFWKPYAEPNQIFLNDGQGHFHEFVGAGDAFTSTVEVSRGLAVGDVDQDGDLDLLVTNVAGRARLYFNEGRKAGRWLEVQASFPLCGGRDDYGAVVTVVAGQRRWMRWIQPASSYLCSNDPRAHFGLGQVERVDRIEVLWSDGQREVFPGGEVDRWVIVNKGATLRPAAERGGRESDGPAERR